MAGIELRRPSDVGGDAFESFMAAEHASVLAFARAVTSSWAEAEDVTQEAFLAAYQRWGAVGGYDRPGSFVRRVVANKSVSRFRRRTREAAAVDRLPLPGTMETEVADPQFWAAVASLPPRQRHVVALRYLEDRPVAEIAEVLGRAEGTVKAHLAAARRNLAARLDVQADHEEEGA